MKPFKKVEIKHEPVTEIFWALKMPLNFTVPGFVSMSFKEGDYLIVQGDGWISGRKREDIDTPPAGKEER